MIKRLLRAVVILTVLIMLAMPVSALSYTYRASGKATQVPEPYEVYTVVGPQLGWNAPTSLCVSEGKVYVLDAGNKRIAVLNSNYEFERNIDITEDGKPYLAQDLTGVWKDGNTLLVVDRRGSTILRTDMDGRVQKAIKNPKTDGSDFLPKKVITDKRGFLYILAENDYRGLMVLTSDGVYDSYFGSAKVTVTARLLVDMFWRRFMTKKQIDSSSQYVTGEYYDMAIDQEGFIYAVRRYSTSATGSVCKLNFAGNNVLIGKGPFTDLDLGAESASSLSSIAVDSDGFISVLDSERNRIFQYSPEGNLIYAFGGKGTVEGTFTYPVEIAVNGEDLLVLDRDANALTVFRCKEFGKTVRKAISLYQKASFDEAAVLWRQVLQQASNYELAYVGCGKVYEANKQYYQALKYYKNGNARDEYSSAFKKYRTALLRNYIGWILSAIVLSVAAFKLFHRFRKKPAGDVVKISWENRGKLHYIAYLMIHPADGFAELRYNHKYSLLYANCIAALWFLTACLNSNYNGFIFRPVTDSEFDIFISIGSTVGALGLFTLVNWLLSTFFEGKGRLKEIWIYLSYSMLPLVAGNLLELVLTNVLSADEAVFISVLRTGVLVWTLLLGFIALSKLHQYGTIKCLFTVFCTVAGILILLFLVFLMINLWTQVVGFVGMIVKEVTYRRMAGIY
jgi:tetratricopeptide (TPR) repeat protein